MTGSAEMNMVNFLNNYEATGVKLGYMFNLERTQVGPCQMATAGQAARSGQGIQGPQRLSVRAGWGAHKHPGMPLRRAGCCSLPQLIWRLRHALLRARQHQPSAAWCARLLVYAQVQRTHVALIVPGVGLQTVSSAVSVEHSFTLSDGDDGDQFQASGDGLTRSAQGGNGRGRGKGYA